MTSETYPGLPARYEPRIHRSTVTAVRRLGPGMIRVTLGGPDMADYPTTGVGDEYVRLFFPDQPNEPVRLPFVADRGWDYPEGVEPSQMRTYTIRAHRPGEVDVDFATHDGGVAGTWVQQAAVGQEVGLNPPISLYELPRDATHQILLADEPALPAALRIAELTSDRIRTTVIGEVRGAEYQLRAEAGAPESIEYVWLRGTGNGVRPSEMLSTLRRRLEEPGVPADPGGLYIWAAGETRLTRLARGLLRKELGWPGSAYKIVGYWTDKAELWRERWEELGPEFHDRIMSLYDEDMDPEERVDEVERLYESVGL